MKNLLLLVLTWWNRQTFGTWVHTLRYGEFVGQDEFGNRYYRTKGGKKDALLGFQRRWVVFSGYAEASAIPPGWHGWMHQRTDVPPSEETYAPWPWQKPHVTNMTGTAAAHRPSGSLLGSAKRASASGDYQAWRPE